MQDEFVLFLFIEKNRRKRKWTIQR